MRKRTEFYNSKNEFNSAEYLKYLKKVFRAASVPFNKDGEKPSQLSRIFEESGLSIQDFKPVMRELSTLSQEIMDQNKPRCPFNEESIQEKFRGFKNAFSEWQQSVPADKLKTIMKKFEKVRISIEGENNFDLSDFFRGGPLNIVSKTVMDTQFMPQNPDDRTNEKKLKGNTMIKLPVNEELFPEGSPCEEDVNQTVNGACYMLGPLRSLAGQNPDYIKRMFAEHKDGFVTVRFPGYGEVKIEKSVSKLWDPKAKPWVRLMEKAYVATGLKNAPFKGPDGTEHYDMNNVGWYFESEFIDAITSQETEPEHTDEDYIVEPTMEDSRRRLGEMLLEAKRNHATISTAYTSHIIQVEDVVEALGTVYIKTYDQLFGITRHHSVDELLSNRSPLNRLSFQVIQGEPPYKTASFNPRAQVNTIEERNASLKEESLTKSFLSLIQNAMIRTQGRDITWEQGERKAKELLAQSNNLKDFFKREFEKLPKELKNKDFTEMTAKGNDYRKSMIHKMREEVLKVLPEDSQDQSVQNIRRVFSQPKLFETCGLMNEEFTKPYKPINKRAFRSPERMQELRGKIRECYENLEERGIDRRGKNSVEYEAMTDSLRDLNAVMQDPNADARLVNYLMERAYVKCNYYQKNKNPFSISGKARKNAALEAMKNIELINPTIRSDVMRGGKEKTLLEMACIRTKQAMELRMSGYRNKYEAMADAYELRDHITEELNRPELKVLAKQIHNENSWAVFEKMCQKEPQEAMRNYLDGRLADLANPQNERNPEAVKAAEDHLKRAVNVEIREDGDEPIQLS